MEYAVAEYGVFAVVFGAMFEGEAALLLAVFLAHNEYLPLREVIVAGWIGAVLGDHLWFYGGRVLGPRWMETHPAFARRAMRVRDFVIRHQYITLLGFRFVIGMRTVIPFSLGLVGISRLRFLAFNLVSGLAWATLYGTMGAFIVGIITRAVDHLLQNELRIALVIALVLLCAWLIARVRGILRERHARQKRARRRAAGETGHRH